MNSGVLDYQLQTFTGLIRHGLQDVAFLRDGYNEQPAGTKLELEAQIRSGDYFINLATTLDSLGREVVNYDIRSDLEDLVSELIYLQDNYTITKNSDH